jgi:hypothetical protein
MLGFMGHLVGPKLHHLLGQNGPTFLGICSNLSFDLEFCL